MTILNPECKCGHKMIYDVNETLKAYETDEEHSSVFQFYILHAYLVYKCPSCNNLEKLAYSELEKRERERLANIRKDLKERRYNKPKLLNPDQPVSTDVVSLVKERLEDDFGTI